MAETSFAPADDDDGGQQASALRPALLAGAVAGTVVDASLFPIDTIKTRLQAGDGRGAWRFTGLYRGFGAAVIASAPCGMSGCHLSGVKESAYFTYVTIGYCAG